MKAGQRQRWLFINTCFMDMKKATGGMEIGTETGMEVMVMNITVALEVGGSRVEKAHASRYP